jgi:hypothetical protein
MFPLLALLVLKNLELPHYVHHLQDENDELRKMMGWLSGHEPQLWMMIETYKRYDGQALGLDKIGECSGEGGKKIGDIQAPPKTFHKNAYAPKQNPLRKKLDTTPDPPIFPHPTNDFQKPIKFKSNLGNVFFLKEGVRSLVRRNRNKSRVRRNMVSSPNPSLNLSSYSFIVTIVGEMVTRVSFASRGSVRREWLKSGITRIGITLQIVYLSLVYKCPGPYDRRQGVVLKSHPGGDKEVHHLWGQWARACAVKR